MLRLSMDSYNVGCMLNVACNRGKHYLDRNSSPLFPSSRVNQDLRCNRYPYGNNISWQADQLLRSADGRYYKLVLLRPSKNWRDDVPHL